MRIADGAGQSSEQGSYCLGAIDTSLTEGTEENLGSACPERGAFPPRC